MYFQMVTGSSVFRRIYKKLDAAEARFSFRIIVALFIQHGFVRKGATLPSVFEKVPNTGADTGKHCQFSGDP